MDKEVQGDVTADKESNKCNVSPETSSNESELATSSHVPPTTATITAQRSEQRHESSTSCDNGMEGDSVSVSSQPLTSTPLRGDVNVDTGRERVRFDVDSVSVSDSVSRDSVSSRESLVPEQISVPIQGFEIMEERAKFTVFKIKVEKSESDSWFVFRRYTDFVQLNEKLRRKFPKVRLSLPPKRWFKDNFDKDFIEDRVLGLQAFINNCIGHKDICNSRPVREFFCFDEPPGPHDSLEESRALCDNLEESVYRLRKEVSEKDTEISLLREELDLYKRQVEMLSQALRDKNAGIHSLESPASVGETSLTSDDLATCPEADQSQVQANMVNNSGHTEEEYCNGELDKECSDSVAKDKSPVASETNSKQSKKKFSIFHSKGGKSQVAAVNS